MVSGSLVNAPRTEITDIVVTGDDARDIQNLSAAYFHRVDRPDENAVADLFSDDALLILGNLRIEGRQAIAAFFEARNQEQTESGRVTRHVSGGIDLTADDSGLVRGFSTTVVYAGNGALPLPAEPPTTICDFDDVYERSSGRWLFKERRGTVIFTSPRAAAFAK